MILVEIIEKTFFASSRYWGSLNSSLCNLGHIWAMSTGIESADLNFAWNEKQLTEHDFEIVQQIKKYFLSKNLPFWWWVFPGAQTPQTAQILEKEGFSLVDRLASMAVELRSVPLERANNTDLRIEQVMTEEGLMIWEDVSFRGFEFPQHTRRQYNNFVRTFNIKADSPQTLFLASSWKVTIGTALLFCQEGAGGIYFISTLPNYRKKGVGLAIVQAVMRFAHENGRQYCSLQATPAGWNVYSKAGFKEYSRADIYCLKQHKNM